MVLWVQWLRVASELRGACARTRTFLWMLVALMGFSVRGDMLGVSSFMRALGLQGECYPRLVALFHTPSIDLNALTRLWVRIVLRIFSGVVRVNGRIVLIADGIKVAKAGKKMPGVKSLHQESDNNNKGEYIMGHSCQAISLLVQAKKGFFAVPLIARIHEGFIEQKTKAHTLLDKMLQLSKALGITEPYYFVADAYYANGKTAKGFLATGNHLITRLKSNAVAYAPFEAKGPRTGAGRHKKYGTKQQLGHLFNEPLERFTQASSPVYGEKNVTIHYCDHQLYWRPLGELVRFVVVIHPVRGKIILMCTDLYLSALEIIKLYSLRFKIEVGFKASLHVLGAYTYRFWLKGMAPTKKHALDMTLDDKSSSLQEAILTKLAAYHRYIQLALIAQGLLQYLSAQFTEQVWKTFGSWMRTMRLDAAPSEWVVSLALKNSLGLFLTGGDDEANLKSPV